ncbi:TetR/AcrR family transcriptional regulator [Macrococcus sp. EM39E]|uniref:TetR/AcrR family transcriptional regulator n=1 Tax=Macrococcus animalis TaxID=3395467 RepID=UPI0039BE1482
MKINNEATKQLLTKGLLKILNNKMISEVTVTELCNVSQVSRRTFYRYYNNTMELLDEMVSELLTQYKEKLEETKNDNQNIESQFYNFWYKQKDFVKVLIINDQMQKIYIPSLTILLAIKSSTSKDDLNDINVVYNHGGMWSVLMYSINNNIEIDNETFDRIINKI